MDYDGMTLLELKKLCKSRGLTVSGTKDEVIIRLMENDESSNVTKTTVTSNVANPQGFVTINTVQENGMMKNLKFVLTLGNLANRQLISSMGLRQTDFKFGHKIIHTLPNKKWKLVNSYHPSRYNINTKRLTYQMFLEVIQKLTH